MDGFSTLDEAEGESLCLRISSRERRAQDISISLSLAKYLLSVLGDQFCEAIRRDREAWLWAQGENESKSETTVLGTTLGHGDAHLLQRVTPWV